MPLLIIQYLHILPSLVFFFDGEWIKVSISFSVMLTRIRFLLLMEMGFAMYYQVMEEGNVPCPRRIIMVS